MNAGTAIFLIVLVLIGSFAGLGYLINQNITITEELGTANTSNTALEKTNLALSQEITRLQDALTACQTERTSLQTTINACQVENITFREQIRAQDLELNHVNSLLSQCQQSGSVLPGPEAPVDPQPAAPATQSGSGSNTITWLMLVTVFVTMVTGWGVVLRTVRLSQQEQPPRPQPAASQPLTVRMTRQQMQEYIAWKRQHK
jgi:uncharacterized protein HemX